MLHEFLILVSGLASQVADHWIDNRTVLTMVVAISCLLGVLLLLSTRWWNRAYRPGLVSVFLILATVTITVAFGVLFVGGQYLPAVFTVVVRQWKVELPADPAWSGLAFRAIKQAASEAGKGTGDEILVTASDPDLEDAAARAAFRKFETDHPFLAWIAFPFASGRESSFAKARQLLERFYFREREVERFIGGGKSYYFRVSESVAPPGVAEICGVTIEQTATERFQQARFVLRSLAIAMALFVQGLVFVLFARAALKGLRPAT